MKKYILASGSPRRRELLGLLDIDFDVVISDCDEDTDADTPEDLVMSLSGRKCRAVRKLLAEKEQIPADALQTGKANPQADELQAGRTNRQTDILQAVTTDRQADALQAGGTNRQTDVSQAVNTDRQADALQTGAQHDINKCSHETRRGHIIIGADTIVVLDGNVLGKPKDETDAFNMLRALSGNTHTVYTGVTLLDSPGGQASSFFEATDVTMYELTDKEILDYIATGDPMDKAGSYGIQSRGALLVKKINGDYFNVVGLPVAKLCRELKKFEKILC